ncbi:MAG: cytochrome c maturation protein CcmE [Deltaproteobacteria bacterium]|nr:cytochrome c maturation protein CcmE [Deltaproteobacteria bacterium]
MRIGLWSKVAVSVAVVGVAVGLMAYSFSRSSGTYVKVDELLADHHLGGKVVWLGGRIVPGSHQWKQGPSEPVHRFALEWNGKKVHVEYRGSVPPGLADGRQVTVRGRYDPQRGFMASKVTTKCPSKYKAR